MCQNIGRWRLFSSFFAGSVNIFPNQFNIAADIAAAQQLLVVGAAAAGGATPSWKYERCVRRGRR